MVVGSTVERGAVFDESLLEAVCYFRSIRFGNIGERILSDDLFEASLPFIVVVGSSVDNPAPFVMLALLEDLGNHSFRGRPRRNRVLRC